MDEGGGAARASEATSTVNLSGSLSASLSLSGFYCERRYINLEIRYKYDQSRGYLRVGYDVLTRSRR